MLDKRPPRLLLGRAPVVTAALCAFGGGMVLGNADAGPAIVVVGVDRTAGWRAMTRDALRTAESALTATLNPGDVAEIRLISEASWPATNHLGTVRIPVRDVPPRRSFQESAHVRAERQRLEREYLARLAAALAQIRADLWSTCWAESATTDIGGFLQAAAERFAVYPPDWNRSLYIVSDFEERRHWSVNADLSTVEIVLYPLRESPQPAEAAAHIAGWSGQLIADTMATNVRVERPVELPPARRDCE